MLINFWSYFTNLILLVLLSFALHFPKQRTSKQKKSTKYKYKYKYNKYDNNLIEQLYLQVFYSFFGVVLFRVRSLKDDMRFSSNWKGSEIQSNITWGKKKKKKKNSSSSSSNNNNNNNKYKYNKYQMDFDTFHQNFCILCE